MFVLDSPIQMRHDSLSIADRQVEYMNPLGSVCRAERPQVPVRTYAFSPRGFCVVADVLMMVCSHVGSWIRKALVLSPAPVNSTTAIFKASARIGSEPVPESDRGLSEKRHCCVGPETPHKCASKLARMARKADGCRKSALGFD